MRFLEQCFSRSLIRVGPSFEYYVTDFAASNYLGVLDRTPGTDLRTQRLLGLNFVFD
jgi:hypothetical protein